MPGLALRCSMVSVIALKGGRGQERVLLLRRAGIYLQGAWSYVAGHVDPGETGWQAARRELGEETGLAPERFYATSFCEQFYASNDDCIEVVPAFVAMIAADAEVRINAEHSAFRWLTFDEAMTEVPFGSQRDLLAYVEHEFIDRPPCEFLRIGSG